MDGSFYWLGVALAILSGFFHDFGTVLQKIVINKLPVDAKFMRSLIKKPLWLSGFLMQQVLGTICFLIAQVFIGPALIPGLMASGLISLTIGSIIIIGERLKKIEIFAIMMMILAITLLGLSELSIEVTKIDLLELGFVIRMISFTAILIVLALFCDIGQRKIEQLRGPFLAIYAGFFYGLCNFWIAPLMGVITHVFEGTSSVAEFILFIISCAILVFSNFYAIVKLQNSYKYGQASNMAPIALVPQQIAPLFVYFWVFMLSPPNEISIFYMLVGVALILISSFILSKRQARIEEIK
jgi:hypothetical protein